MCFFATCGGFFGGLAAFVTFLSESCPFRDGTLRVLFAALGGNLWRRCPAASTQKTAAATRAAAVFLFVSRLRYFFYRDVVDKETDTFTVHGIGLERELVVVSFGRIG